MNSSIADQTGAGWKRTLWLVVVLALLIRLWGTWYGLPFSYWVDEYHEVLRALELGAGGFNFERISKGGFYFLLFIEYGLYFVFLKVTGVVATAQDFAKTYVRDPSAFYLIGRVTAALIGSITVVAVFHLGRRAYSISAGLLAALFLAINVLHIDLSRRIGVDVPMTMLAALALIFALRIAAEGRKSDYLIAALCAALATTTKVTGILVLLPLLIAHTYAVANRSGGLRGWFGTRELWLAAAVFVGVLVATNPGIVVGAGGLLSLFSSAPIESLDEESFGAVAEMSGGSAPSLYIYYLSALQASMGWPLFGLGLVAMAYALWKRAPADIALVFYAVVNYVAISSTTSDTLYYPRYTLPIIVVMAVLSGRALADLMSVFTRRRVAAMAVIVVACIVLPVGQVVTTAYALTQTDTRTLAKQWFDAHVPAGSRVLIEGLKIGPVKGTVQLQETPEAIKRRIEYWKTAEPKQAKFLELELAVHGSEGYDLELVELESVDALEDYAARGVEYFVIRPENFMDSRLADLSSGKLLSDLRSDARVKLVKRFEGNSRTQLGPTIEIYRLSSGRAAITN